MATKRSVPQFAALVDAVFNKNYVPVPYGIVQAKTTTTIGELQMFELFENWATRGFGILLAKQLKVVFVMLVM